jgi:hypothetical protein
VEALMIDIESKNAAISKASEVLKILREEVEHRNRISE